MKRRNFINTLGTGSLAAVTIGSSGFTELSHAKNTIQEKKKVLMKVGCQSGGVTVKDLEFKARHGVFNIDGGAPKFIPGTGWDLQDSLDKKEMCAKYGIALDAYHFPLSSVGIDKVPFPNVMLGKSPERDKE
ncbi:MAG TPA: mannonate dehydratase, partial [Cyclobacteriaceae bacterium]|nr:mannonate dehydratase [Cyclobacteriaceae bacterium]